MDGVASVQYSLYTEAFRILGRGTVVTQGGICAARTARKACLHLFNFMLILLLIAQGGLVISLFVHKDFVPHLPSPTPDEQKVIDFIKHNLKYAKIIGIVALAMEVRTQILLLF